MQVGSLMQLEQCFLRKLDVQTNPKAIAVALDEKTPNPASQGAEPEYQFIFRHSPHSTKSKYWVTYGFKMIWPESRRTHLSALEIQLDGVFSFPEGTPEEERAKYVPIHCFTLLHGHARGIIAQATGSCPGGPLQLPVLNMKQAYESARAAHEAAQQAKPAPAKKALPKRISRAKGAQNKRPTRKAPKAATTKKRASKKTKPSK